MLRHCQREYLADFKLAFEDLGARKGGLELKDKEGVGKDWGGGKSEGNAHAACVWNRLPSSHTADLCCFPWFQEPKEGGGYLWSGRQRRLMPCTQWEAACTNAACALLCTNAACALLYVCMLYVRVCVAALELVAVSCFGKMMETTQNRGRKQRLGKDHQEG